MPTKVQELADAAQEVTYVVRAPGDVQVTARVNGAVITASSEDAETAAELALPTVLEVAPPVDDAAPEDASSEVAEPEPATPESPAEPDV